MNWTRWKQLWSWIGEAKNFWGASSVIVLALVISLWPPTCRSVYALFVVPQPETCEPVIRWVGMVLQLLGILTVAWGISETRALFGHPTFASKLNQWLARMPLLPRNVVIGVGSANLGMIGFNARGHTSYPIDPSANIPQRLSALEKNIQLIQDRITQTQAELDKGLSEAKGVLEKERLSREEEDCAIREKLEATGTGGVHISAIGAAWLFVGVILSTAAIELAGLIK